ncbi:MAG: hypothetical protein ACQGVK_02780 [Myxococcota bacterium]
MTSDRQKSREQFWVERFRAESGLDFRIDDSRERKERPDFLLRYAGRIVGLEVTELQVDRGRGGQYGSALQKELGLQQAVVRRAQEIYFGQGHAPINAQVYFRSGPGLSLELFDRASIADALAILLSAVSIEPMDQHRIDSRSAQAPPAPISFVVVRGIPGSITPRWQLIPPGWAKVFAPSDVESVLSAKNALYTEYSENADAVWLLIVADGSKPPGMFSAPAEPSIDLPHSSFDKTYLLCEPSRFMIEWSESGRGSRIARRCS